MKFFRELKCLIMEGVQVPSAFYFPEVKKNLSAHLETHLNLLLILLTLNHDHGIVSKFSWK